VEMETTCFLAALALMSLLLILAQTDNEQARD
jgi:hypothetical protein